MKQEKTAIHNTYLFSNRSIDTYLGNFFRISYIAKNIIPHEMMFIGGLHL